MFPEGTLPFGMGCCMVEGIRETRIDACWIVIIVIREPWFRLGIVSVASRGLAPLWGGMRRVHVGS